MRKEEAKLKCKPIKRFFKYVDITKTCWLWVGGKTWNGYGRFKEFGRKHILAHHFSWLTFYGKKPSNKLVLHSCDIRNCVNPDHLFLGTAKDNTRDMLLKNRGRWKKP